MRIKKKAKYPEFAFVSFGGGNPSITHHCAGEPVVKNFLKLALIQLCMYEWKLPDQDFSINPDELAPIPKSKIIISNFSKIK